MHLFGGPADGRLLELEDYVEQVAVYRLAGDGLGDLIALPEPAMNGSAGDFLGIYRMVGSRGPDRPVYVFSSI